MHRGTNQGTASSIIGRADLKPRREAKGWLRQATGAALRAPIAKLSADEQRIHNEMVARRARLRNQSP